MSHVDARAELIGLVKQFHAKVGSLSAALAEVRRQRPGLFEAAGRQQVSATPKTPASGLGQARPWGEVLDGLGIARNASATVSKPTAAETRESWRDVLRQIEAER